MSLSVDIHSVETHFARPIHSSTLTRWERKKLQNMSAKKTPRNNKQKDNSDRFIPKRDLSSSNLSRQFHHTYNSVSNNENNDNSNVSSVSGVVKQDFNSKLAQSLYDDDLSSTRILSFKSKAPKPTEGHHNNMRVLYTQNRTAEPVAKKSFRHIDKTPERILDAPELLDDFYVNLLDWSVGNLMAVALGTAVYLWDATTGNIELLCENEEEDNNITSIYQSIMSFSSIDIFYL